MGTSTVVVGQYGFNAQQLQDAGIIKPGSAPLVQSLVDKGVPLANAIPSNLFTGSQGAQNLAAFISNPQAQAGAAKDLLSSAATKLTNAGVITGSESPTQVAGLVKSAATAGIGATIDAVKGSAGALTGDLKAAGSAAIGKVGGALNAIASGNKAAGFADSVTSGLGGVKNALEGLAKAQGLTGALDQAKGVAASAFNAIKGAFPKLPAGVPVNVFEAAKDALEKASAAATTVPGAPTGGLAALKSKGSALLNKAQGAVAGVQGQLSGGAAALGKSLGAAAGTVASNLTGAAAGASPTGFVGKGGSTLVATVNSLSPTINAAAGGLIDKAQQVAATINPAVGTTASSLTNAFGGASSAVSKVTGGVGGLLQGGVSTLASGLTNLPGGAGAAGSLVNMAKGGTSKLTGALDKIAGGLKDAATAKLGNLKPPALDLEAALSKSGLPAGFASQLETAVAAMGAGGGAPVKMATIAVNTTNRADITAQISSTLGDPGIPAPNLGEVSEATVSAKDAATSSCDELRKQADEAFDYWANSMEPKRKYLRQNLDSAINNYPQGDGRLKATQAEYDAFRGEWTAARDKALKLSEQFKAQCGV